MIDEFARQTPGPGEIYLDHVGWFVRDVSGAAAAFERLGFLLTPFVVSRNAGRGGGPGGPAGTGNRCAMLHRGYLELIAAIEGLETPLARQHREAVSRHEGVHVVAFTVADMATAHARLAGHGFDPLEPVLLRRPIQVPGQGAAEARFTVVRVPPEKMPEGRIQVLTQETPDLVWQPRLIAREHGLTALGATLMCVDDPAAAAARYERFLERPALVSAEAATVRLDRGRIGFATPAACRRLLPGVEFPSAPSVAAVVLVADDPEMTRRFLHGRGVPLIIDDRRRFGVHPVAAGGTTIVVHGPTDVWPVFS